MDRCAPTRRARRPDRHANCWGHALCGHALLETPGRGAASSYAPPVARCGYREGLRRRDRRSGIQRAAYYQGGDNGPNPAGARRGARRRIAGRDHGGRPVGGGTRGRGRAPGDPERGLSTRAAGPRAGPVGGRFPGWFRALVDAGGSGSRRLRRGWHSEWGAGRFPLGAPLMEDRLRRRDQQPLLRRAVVLS
jgi:hypothetical protein